MNCYRYADLKLAQTESFRAQLTEAMLNSFCTLSGDQNPLHADERYAASRGHPARVVHGFLVGALLSRLVGMHLPGKHALLHGTKLAFEHPVYVGDELLVQGEITHLTDAYRRVEIRVAVTNQRGARVARGLLQVGMYE